MGLEPKDAELIGSAVERSLEDVRMSCWPQEFVCPALQMEPVLDCSGALRLWSLLNESMTTNAEEP